MLFYKYSHLSEGFVGDSRCETKRFFLWVCLYVRKWRTKTKCLLKERGIKQSHHIKIVSDAMTKTSEFAFHRFF